MTATQCNKRTIELLNTIPDEVIKQKALTAFESHPAALVYYPGGIDDAIDNFKWDKTEDGGDFWYRVYCSFNRKAAKL